MNDYRVLDGQPLLVVAPTTSGKTFIGELAAARAIADGRKAVFLLPFNALANEKYEEFEELYGQELGLRVLRCTGDYADETEPFAKGHYDVALLTYEMFLGLSVAMPTLLSKIGLVILDEAQFITDPTRGIGVVRRLCELPGSRPWASASELGPRWAARSGPLHDFAGASRRSRRRDSVSYE